MSEITHAGRDYRFYPHTEYTPAVARPLRSEWESVDLGTGRFAGTPVVAEARRVSDAAGTIRLPVVLRRKI